ncbi:MAG: hypothetical protein NTZ09_07275 [Candidatus Hydrogenedentes bacterium]|nr:hypothetical protein [Candidatus Hydrogenedentota bacterium]
MGGSSYLRAPVELLAERICEELAIFLPIAFKKNLPKDENDLNDKIQACLSRDKEKFEREHPTIVFGLARTVPDHSSYDLLVEVKFLRDGTTPSKASEGIAADLTKYPKQVFKLFIVYDPYRKICDDATFRRSFEEQGMCRVHVVR